MTVISKHARLTLGDNHPIHSFQYAEAVTRLNASGFLPEDLHKVALQMDDRSLWMLTQVQPSPIWKQVGAQTFMDTLTFSVPDVISIFEGKLRWYPPCNIKLVDACVAAYKPSTTGATTFALKRNGNLVDNITLPTTSPLSTRTALPETHMAATDYLTCDSLTTSGAEFITVMIRYQKEA